MATIFLSLAPNTILSPFPGRARPINGILDRTQLSNFHNQTPLLRGRLLVTRAGLGQIPGPDPDGLFARVEGLLYTIADAAVNGSAVDKVTEAAANDVVTKQNGDWLSGITNAMEAVLKVLKDGLSSLHVPYAYGFAIILLTVLVKAATFPLTKKQVESAMAMRSLAPQIKAIQERYAGEQERIQLETARLYKLAGINPLAGCLPTLATIPIWIGLYRALSNVANEGLLTEGFFWIPSLAGPTTIAARQTGSGTSWLFPFIDGHPPLGWSDTLAYLVLPVLLVVSQYISIQIMQPSQGSDPNQKTNQVLTRFLPLMVGYFSLSVPSGLSLYWLTNNILSTAQQVWLQKLGGAKNPVSQLSDDLRKKDPSIIKKSISQPTTVKKITEENKSPTAEGPRPGERFKQLKEQEARRRRQREGEKRKAEEAAAKGIQIANEEPKKEVNLVRTEDKSRTELHDASSMTNISNSTIAENRVLNGDSTSQRLEDDEETVVNMVSHGQTTSDPENGKGDHYLDENPKKEEVVSAVKRKEKLSGENVGENRGD